VPTLATKTGEGKIEIRGIRVPRYILEVTEVLNQVSVSIENTDLQISKCKKKENKKNNKKDY